MPKKKQRVSRAAAALQTKASAKAKAKAKASPPTPRPVTPASSSSSAALLSDVPSLKVAQLKARLEELGLDCSGRKAELAQRLTAKLSEMQQAAAQSRGGAAAKKARKRSSARQQSGGSALVRQPRLAHAAQRQAAAAAAPLSAQAAERAKFGELLAEVFFARQPTAVAAAAHNADEALCPFVRVFGLDNLRLSLFNRLTLPEVARVAEVCVDGRGWSWAAQREVGMSLGKRDERGCVLVLVLVLVVLVLVLVLVLLLLMLVVVLAVVLAVVVVVVVVVVPLLLLLTSLLLSLYPSVRLGVLPVDVQAGVHVPVLRRLVTTVLQHSYLLYKDLCC